MFDEFKGRRSRIFLFFKYSLFFVNFLLFVASGMVIGLMAWVIDQKEKHIQNALDFFLDPPCVFLTAACVAIVMAILGWYGPLRENVIVLKVYRWLMVLLFIAEMVLVIFIFVIVYVPNARRDLHIYPENSLRDAIVSYRDDADRQNLIDGIQAKLECCGVSNDDMGYKDWTDNAYFNCSKATTGLSYGEYCSVPFSCCKATQDGNVNYLCGKDMQRDSVDPAVRARTIYTRGCFKAVSFSLMDNTLVVGGVLLAVFIPQIIFTFMAGRLAYNIQDQKVVHQSPKHLIAEPLPRKMTERRLPSYNHPHRQPRYHSPAHHAHPYNHGYRYPGYQGHNNNAGSRNHGNQGHPNTRPHEHRELPPVPRVLY